MHPRPHLLVVTASAELYGSDRTLLHALPTLAKAYRVTVAVPFTGPAVPLLEAAGATVVTVPDLALRRRNISPAGLLPWLRRSVAALTALRRLHRRDAVDLVYINSLASAVGCALGPLLRVPVLTHVHECPVEPRWFPRLLLPPVAACSTVLVCNSAYTLGLAAAHAARVRDRGVVVHNGIEIPPPPEPLPPATRFRIGCVGRLHPKKGQWVLLSAARIAAERGSDWELHFYGDALPEHAELASDLRRQATRDGLADRVFWHGFVADTAALYTSTDVSVVPSVVCEEFSLVCAEAQVRGRPVVATGPGGPSEVVADGVTGLIVPPDDAPALATALRRLEHDPALREAMGRAGRARMVERFSVERYAERLLEICGQTRRPIR